MADGQVLITSKDRELFTLLFMFRVMTIEQIRRIRYFDPKRGTCSAFDNVRKRLRRLWQAGFIKGSWVYLESEDARLEDTRHRAYILSRGAIPHLRRSIPNLTQTTISEKFPLRTIDHSFLVSECGCRLLESARRPGIQLINLSPYGLPLYHSRVASATQGRMAKESFVTQDEVWDGTSHLTIRPDLVFALQADLVRSRLFFLEVDRGLESHQQLATKIRAYRQYRENRMYSSYHKSIQDIRVLIATTSWERVSQLSSGLSNVPGFEILGMTTLEEIRKYSPDEPENSKPNMVASPIWLAPTGTKEPLMLPNA